MIVLKAGRSREATQRGNAPSADSVFEAAIRRAGTVRVRTYTQLFAAARILSLGRIPRGDRLAIIANGRGPALLAADTAASATSRLAEFDPATLRALDALLPDECERSNPVDVRADAPPERFAGAVAAVLADANVDAVVALHVPRPSIGPTDAARAVAEVARGASKPVLAAWLGAIDRPEVRAALEAGGIANFYTPENAVEAFSFLAAYSRHQKWLLEVPPPQEEPEIPDLASAEAVRREAEGEGRTTLSDEQSSRLLAAFGLHAMPAAVARGTEEAKRMARQFGYPVSLEVIDARTRVPIVTVVATRAAARCARRCARVRRIDRSGAADRQRRGKRLAIIVRKEAGDPGGPELSLGMYTDATFGPVIAFGASVRSPLATTERALMLPPLNRRLAVDLLNGMRGRRARRVSARRRCERGAGARHAPGVRDGLRVALARGARARSVDACAGATRDRLRASLAVDPRRVHLANYAHMAIHPYPAELVTEVRARNGAHRRHSPDPSGGRRSSSAGS